MPNKIHVYLATTLYTWCNHFNTRLRQSTGISPVSLPLLQYKKVEQKSLPWLIEILGVQVHNMFSEMMGGLANQNILFDPITAYSGHILEHSLSVFV